MSRYISKLEGVDPERGDTFVSKWSDAIGQLIDFTQPIMAGHVIQAFVRWGKGGEIETLETDWENSVLNNLIEHQRAETRDYFRTCHNRERKEYGATYVETSGDNSTQVVNKTKPKEKLKPKGNSISLSGGRTDRGGLTSPDCPSLSVEEAKKILAMNAPDVTSHKEMKTPNGNKTTQCLEFIRAHYDTAMLMVATAIYPNALGEIGDDAADTLRSVLDGKSDDDYENWNLPKSFHKTPIGSFLKSAHAISKDIEDAYSTSDNDNSYAKMESAFVRTIVAAYLDSKDPMVRNPAAFIIARLKKVLDAVKVLEGMNAGDKASTTQEQPPSQDDDWE